MQRYKRRALWSVHLLYHAASIPHKTRQHNNSNNRHSGNKKEDKFMLKKQLTQRNLTNNRRIRRNGAWSTAATDTAE
jgi:hypothetical protein